MPNGAIRYDEWLCTCRKRNFMQKAFCRESGELPTKTQKQHGAGGNGKNGGASPRQAPPKSPTPSASGETTKTTNNDYFEKIAKGLAAVKESLREGEKEVLSPIELELSEVIKQFDDGEEDVQMGNAVQNTQTEYWQDVEKRWTNAENTQQKEAVFQ